MSQAHNLLLAGDWRGAAVADLVRESRKPFLVDQVGLEMHGPDTFLKADAAQTMSLVLHELATNAAKFGALTWNAFTMTPSVEAIGELRTAWSWLLPQHYQPTFV